MIARVRFTKSEIAQRKTAQATLEAPDASSTAKYHARLLLKQTEEDARARAERIERPPAPKPTPTFSRYSAPNPKAEKFLAEVDAFLARQEAEALGASIEAPQTEVEAAESPDLTPRAPHPTEDQVCDFCLIPRQWCHHGAAQSDEENSNERTDERI